MEILSGSTRQQQHLQKSTQCGMTRTQPSIKLHFSRRLLGTCLQDSIQGVRGTVWHHAIQSPEAYAQHQSEALQTEIVFARDFHTLPKSVAPYGTQWTEGEEVVDRENEGKVTSTNGQFVTGRGSYSQKMEKKRRQWNA